MRAAMVIRLSLWLGVAIGFIEALDAEHGSNVSDHQKLTVEQFTRMAIPFSKMTGHMVGMDLLINLANATKDDMVLDVACGPGLVAMAFAPHVSQVDGIDITPEMIIQARKAQTENGMTNLNFSVGLASPLPFPNDHFSLVITRYSFHHFKAPKEVLAEMIRVCKPGGRILVADVAVPSAKVQAYDRMERLRDPSHVGALTREDFAVLLGDAGLTDIHFSQYKTEFNLEEMLTASMTSTESAQELREIFREDVGKDHLGVGAEVDESGSLRYFYPIAVTVGRKKSLDKIEL